MKNIIGTEATKMAKYESTPSLTLPLRGREGWGWLRG